MNHLCAPLTENIEMQLLILLPLQSIYYSVAVPIQQVAHTNQPGLLPWQKTAQKPWFFFISRSFFQLKAGPVT